MRLRKRAFTLIELLVVIAIIAILAAILFPVFAQAKAAAKATASISNMKQIGVGLQMYLSDNDDTYSPRRTVVQRSQPDKDCDPIITTSWKQNTYPYIKNVDIFTDPVNPAAKGLDDTSDPDFLATQGRVIAPGAAKMARGYAFADIPFIHKKAWSPVPCFDGTFGPSILESPANVLAIAEHKQRWVDTGPYLGWEKNAYGWTWGGGKWSDKAMVLVFHDSHAKRTSNGAICGKANEMNAWGYQRDQLNAWGSMGDVQWIDAFCTTMPAEVK